MGIKEQANLGLKMKSIFFVLITIFCSTASAGRPGKRNNLKFECKGTSSYQKKGDTIFGVITGCGDGLQKEIDLMAKKVERLFKQDDMVRIGFDVDYSQNFKIKKQNILPLNSTAPNGKFFSWDVYGCQATLYIPRGHTAGIKGCGKDLQYAIKAFRDEVSQFNDDLVYMTLIIESS